MHSDHAQLQRICTAAGLHPHTIESASGSLLVTKRGARVLGVFLRDCPGNLLWVNPAALPDEATGRQFVAAGGWNVGGDRCWLAPELDLHFLDLAHPTHEEYAVPAAIDPGAYEVEQQWREGLALHATGEAQNLRSRRPFRFHIRRAIVSCAAPVATAGVSYVGYELSSELVIESPDRPDAFYGLWQLMQLPAGGDVLIPVRHEPEIVDYFGTGVARHCRVAADHVVFPITGRAKHKLGLRAADARGTIAYLRPVGGGGETLIVRQAAVFAGATYADFPFAQPERRDIALQFYNDAGGLGPFGEMEYHAPAACPASGFRSCDVSRTWCFAGPAAEIRALASELLGVRLVRV